MAETLWTYKNYVIAAGGVVVIRGQNFNVRNARDIGEIYQLGNADTVGLEENPSTITGTLEWLPIHTQVENAIVGVASTTAEVTMLDITGMTGIEVQSQTGGKGITGAKLIGLTYSLDAPNGRWTARANFSGTAWDSNGAALVADTPSGVGAYKPVHAMIQFETTGAGVTLTRVKALNITVGLTEDKAYQFTTNTPFDIQSMAPQITGSITWHANYESATAGAHSYRPLPATAAAAEDIEIQIGAGAWDAAGNIKYILYACQWQSEEQSVQQRARGEHTIEYRGGGDPTTGGFSAVVIT